MAPTMLSANLLNTTKTLISRHVSPVNEWANKLPALFRPNTTSSVSWRAMATATPHIHEGGPDQCKKCLTLNTMNPCIIEMQYAVRGPLVARASEIEKELERGEKKPFTEVIKANIGDCHAMGQKPITFIRQVLALVSYPPLFDDPSFPSDVKEHAKELLNGCKGGSVGSYSDSPGIECIRRHVAEYIEKRDGIPSDWCDIILSAGASDGIKSVLKLLIADVSGKPPGVMVPIPQYPLYSASLAEFKIRQIDYYLDESKCWALDVAELKRAVKEAKAHCNPRAIVVINPGNPTGQVLTKENIQEIIKFAYEEQLLIIADEVYQHNVYAEGSQFHSFKKVMKELGPPYSDIELASFMSASKGTVDSPGGSRLFITLVVGNGYHHIQTYLEYCPKAWFFSTP